MMPYPQIAQRAFNTPLLVDPAKALAFLVGLGPRLAGGEISLNGPEIAAAGQTSVAPLGHALLFADDPAEVPTQDSGRPFTLVDGVAVIGIAGTLVHRGAWIGQSSGLTSYEGIAAQLSVALADPSVRGIALDIDSFGGEAAGAFDLADRIRAARQVKPLHAFVGDHALSAAYALASQADHIVLSRTGAVGSIGVVAIHSDMSGALDQKGIAVTLLHAGARKVDGNPYQPLPDGVRDRMMRDLEVMRFLFAETVAAGRGSSLDHAATLATEAAVFRGAEAITAGLADELADPITALHAFAASLCSSAVTTRKDLTLTTTPDDPATPPVSPTVTPSAELVAAPPATTPAPADLAAITAEAIRAEVAEVVEVCAQAARLGLQIDAADAVARGVNPEALRAQVLADLAARSDAAGILATAPAAATRESPLVAAARKSAAASR